MMKADNPPDEYKVLVTEIKQRIRDAQYAALKSVNKELIGLYWDIGKMIVKKQERLGWRKSIVETLANDLHFEFPGIDGFSSRNLWNMRNFYLLYVDFPKLQPMAAEISWTKNVIILENVGDANRCVDLYNNTCIASRLPEISSRCGRADGKNGAC